MSFRALSISVLVAAAALLNACGTDCGTGTVEKDGECVAVATCGAGTTLDPATGTCVSGGVDGPCGDGTEYSEMLNQCVPKVDEICTGNTAWDEATGTCVVDEDACQEGTVLRNGQCIPFDESLEGDFQEIAEPNDPNRLETDEQVQGLLAQLQAAAVAVPEIGQSTTIEGCIDPETAWGPNPDNLPAVNDADYFMVNASAPSVIRVRITALGGIAAGFSMAPGQAGIADGWFRLGINLRGDDHEREMYLPSAGSYLFAVDDARNLLTSSPLPVGGPEACYFIEIERQELPAATTAQLGQDYTGPSDQVHVYTLTGEEAQFLTGEVLPNDEDVTERPTMALSASVNNTHRNSTVEESGSTFLFVPALAQGDAVTLVVDHAYNLSRGFDTFKFTPSEIATEAYPENGTGTVTQPEDGFPTAFYFEGTGGDLTNLVASIGSPEDEDRGEADFAVIDSFGQLVGYLCASVCSEGDAWVNTHATGYYYVLPFLEAPGSLEIDFARSSTTPGTFNVGDTKSIDLDADKRVFFKTDFAGSIWLQFLAANRSDIENIDVDYYDLEGTLEASDVLDDSLRASIIQSFGDDALEKGRVTIDDERKFLVSFANSDGNLGGTFDFTIANRDFENVGMLSEANPFAAKSYSVDESDTLYFLGRTSAASTLTLTATPTDGDVVIRELNAAEVTGEEVDEAGAGEAEVLEQVIDGSLVVYAVDVTGETGGTVTVEIEVIDPPYSQTAGSKAFTDVCATGTALTFTDGLSSPVNIAATNFSYFGQTEGQAIVSDQGWFTFDETYADDALVFGPLPALGTSMVAPYATYLDTDIEVCYEVGATSTKIQWKGFESLSFGYVEVQAVLNSNGTIDFIYGPGHAPGFFGGDIGLENQDGSFGLNRTEPVLPGTSVTWTPAGL